MGNRQTVSMEENFRRNQEFITQMNTIKTDRQLQMRSQMREREEALAIASAREMFYWGAGFYAACLLLCLNSYRTKRSPTALLPMLPLSVVFAYQADLAYGTKAHRIRAEAERIMQFEPELLYLPLGLPTASEIDQGRLAAEQKKKAFPHPYIDSK